MFCREPKFRRGLKVAGDERSESIGNALERGEVVAIEAAGAELDVGGDLDGRPPLALGAASGWVVAGGDLSQLARGLAQAGVAASGFSRAARTAETSNVIER